MNQKYNDMRCSNFEYMDLSSEDLSNADISGSNINYADLSKSILINANLSCSELIGCNLSFSNLSGANLNNVNIENANMRGSNLHGANLEHIRGFGIPVKDRAIRIFNELEYPLDSNRTIDHISCSLIERFFNRENEEVAHKIRKSEDFKTFIVRKLSSIFHIKSPQERCEIRRVTIKKLIEVSKLNKVLFFKKHA